FDQATSSTGVVYRFKIIEDETTIFDLNLLNSSNTTVHAGAETIDEDGPETLLVTVSGDPTAASVGSARWVALKTGGQPFFYFGKSPFADDNGNANGLGDELVVSGLDNQDHDYEVIYADSTSASANLGAATTHAFSSDDPNFAGKSIASISITNVSGGAQVALFTPDLLLGTDSEEDTLGATWTLTRSFEDTLYYEPSGTIDRDCWMPVEGEGITFYNGFGAGASFGSFSYQAQSCSVLYRRYWNSGSAVVVNNSESTAYGDFGWKIMLEDGLVKASLWDGVVSHELQWDEDADS